MVYHFCSKPEKISLDNMTNISSHSLICSLLHSCIQHLLSTCCVPGGTQLNARVIERKIKAHTLPSSGSQSNLAERCGNEDCNASWEALITKVCSKWGQPVHWTPVSTVKVRDIPPLLWNNKCLTWLSSVFQFQCDNGDPHHYDKLQGMVLRFPLLGALGRQLVVAEILRFHTVCKHPDTHITRRRE